jgi:hypothetical protein
MSDPRDCPLDCLRSDGTPHPECPIHGRPPEADSPPADTLVKCIDIEPARLKCPLCSHVAHRTPHRDGKGTHNLQRCRYCGHVALWSTFERLDPPSP